MKKLFLLTYFLIFSLSLFATNLVKNGNFELDNNNDGIPDFWVIDDRENIKLENYNKENKVIHIINKTHKYTGLFQYIVIDNEKIKSITVKAKVKIKNVVKGVEDWAFARILVLFFDKNGKQIGGWPELGRFSGSFDFSEKINVFNLPEKTKSIKIEIQLSNCTGEMWVDDLEVLSGAVLPEEEDNENLLYNGDLEYGASLPLYWGGWISGKSSFVSPGYKSSNCFMIKNKKPSYSMITQKIPLDTSIKTIRISGALKTENVVQGKNPWEKARISVEFHDDTHRIGDWPPVTGEITGTTQDWIEFTRDYSLPEGTKSIIVSAGLLNCAGKVYIDKLKVMGFDKKGNVIKKEIFKNEDKSNWWKFEFKQDTYKKDAIIDFSKFLDAPAGKHGFIKVDENGDLVFEDGTKIKFFGVNLVGGDIFRSFDEIDKMVKRLSKIGVNMVRLHHMDAAWADPNIFDKRYNDTRHLSRESLEKLDYLIYKLKNAGIYIFLDLLVHRKLKKGDGVENYDKIPAGFKEVIFIDEKLKDLTREYIKNLLEHENFYTKIKYKDDPAIVFMEIINESSLFYWDRNTDIPAFYTEKLDKLFNEFLKDKYKTMKRLKKEWDKFGDNNLSENEDFNKGTIKREKFEFDWENLTSFAKAKCTGRAADTKYFYYQLELKFYDDMYNFIKNLGGKALITGSNHWELWDADILANSRYDFIDRHSYWDHPSGGWTLQENISFQNLPILKSKFNCISELSHARVLRKPFTVSEWNFLLPNEFRAGAPVIMAAYGKFQGWDAMLQFNFSNYEWKDELTAFCDFSTSPDVLTMWFPAVMIFRYDYLKEDRENFVEFIPQKAVFYDKNTSFKYVNNTPEMPAMVKISRTYEKDKKIKNKNYTLLLKNGVVLTHDKKIYWDYKKGIFKINSEKIQGAIGFLKGEKIKLKNLEIKCDNKYAAIFLTSLDKKTIKNSSELILNVAARVENSNMKFNPSHTSIIFGGNSPIIIEPIYTSLTIDNLDDFKTVKIYKVDENNYIEDEYKNYKIKKNKKVKTLKIILNKNSKTLQYYIKINR